MVDGGRAIQARLKIPEEHDGALQLQRLSSRDEGRNTRAVYQCTRQTELDHDFYGLDRRYCVSILLMAFLLNLLKRVSHDSLIYILLNLFGAAIACFASVLLKVLAVYNSRGRIDPGPIGTKYW